MLSTDYNLSLPRAFLWEKFYKILSWWPLKVSELMKNPGYAPSSLEHFSTNKTEVIVNGLFLKFWHLLAGQGQGRSRFIFLYFLVERNRLFYRQPRICSALLARICLRETSKMGLFFKLFAENYMKMKEFGPRGAASLAPPLPLHPPIVVWMSLILFKRCDCHFQEGPVDTVWFFCL